MTSDASRLRGLLESCDVPVLRSTVEPNVVVADAAADDNPKSCFAQTAGGSCMTQHSLQEIFRVVDEWRTEARMQTRDRAYDLTDLEWLGGRIAALTDVLTLLNGCEVTEPDVRKRLLGVDAVSRSSPQWLIGEAGDQTRSKLAM